MSKEPLQISQSPDIEAVAELLSDAFSDDPVTRWVFPEDTANRTHFLREFFGRTTAIVLAQGGWLVHSHDYAGVVSWLPSSAAGSLSDEQERRLLEDLEVATGPCGKRAAFLITELSRRHPSGLPAHAGVVAAGIRPVARNGGLQRALVGTFRDWVIDAKIGVYAEASSRRSLRLWHRWGLTDCGAPIELPNGPALFPIFADAQTAASTPFE